MSYSMWLGQLYNKTVNELKELRKEHEAKLKSVQKELENYDVESLVEKEKDQERCIEEIDKVLEDKRIERLKKSLVVTDDHIKLLKQMEFEYYPEGGDYVIIGVEGKRPFGNSDWARDIAEILGWKLPNDDLSDKQSDKAVQLMEELPIALNKIIKKL